MIEELWNSSQPVCDADMPNKYNSMGFGWRKSIKLQSIRKPQVVSLQARFMTVNLNLVSSTIIIIRKITFSMTERQDYVQIWTQWTNQQTSHHISLISESDQLSKKSVSTDNLAALLHTFWPLMQLPDRYKHSIKEYSISHTCYAWP